MYAPAMSIEEGALATLRVLDVGCGAGDSMCEELQLRQVSQPVEMVGIDIDEEVLAQGRKNYPEFLFVCAKGEHLPFPDESFDAVISRVAMPYMDIPVTLHEMRRILKPDGELRMKLHPASYTLSELVAELGSGSAKSRAASVVYRSYVIANGLAFHWMGFNFHFPLARHRCESFQTQRGIKKALVAAGFEKIDVSCWETKVAWPHAGDCRASARRAH